MFDPGLRWHVATVLSGREMAAQADLTKRGLVAYYPRQTRWKRTQKGRERVQSAIMPGYVFFRLPEGVADLSEPIQAVTGYLRCGRGLAVIGCRITPDGEVLDWVQDTMDAESRGDFDGTKEAGLQSYRVGQRVKILARAFADRLAVITRVGPKEVQADLQATGWLKGHRLTLSPVDIAPA